MGQHADPPALACILDAGRFNAYGHSSLVTPFACFSGVADGSLLGVQVLPYVT